MSETKLEQDEAASLSPEERLTALFMQMVVQQSNLAMMLLGRMPHPQTGRPVQDIEGAKMFIDQLEMIEARTKGNLRPEEETLLKQSLMSLRLAFVEAVESPAPAGREPATPPPMDSATASAGNTGVKSEPETPEADADSKKKFSKKY